MALNELSAAEAIGKIRNGEVTSEELVQACLARIEQADGEIEAWAHLKPDYALDQARLLDAQRAEAGPVGPLHGIPVGIKDIFDTEGLPTENGTPLDSGRQPDRDCKAVSLLKEAGAEIDHDGEIWATEGYSVPIDRGVLAGRISDLQGRFNLNWLASDNAGPAQAAFERLIRVLGLDIRLGRAVTEHLRPGGPANPAPYYNRALPVTAPGGTIATIAELRRVPGMTEAAFDTLAPHVAALPLGTGLNVNTASAPVLAAVLPGAA